MNRWQADSQAQRLRARSEGAVRREQAGRVAASPRVRAIGRSPAQPGATTGRLAKLFPSLARPAGDEQSGYVSGIQVVCWKPPAQTESERSGNVSGIQVVCRRRPCRRGDGFLAGKAVSVACPVGANEVATYRVVKSYAGSLTRMGATDPRLAKPSPSPARPVTNKVATYQVVKSYAKGRPCRRGGGLLAGKAVSVACPVGDEQSNDVSGS